MTDTNEPISKGIQSQQGLYSKLASKSEEVIQVLFDLLKSPNENARLGAAKTLINKMLPDLKQTALTDPNGEIVKVLVTIDTKPIQVQQVSPNGGGE